MKTTFPAVLAHEYRDPLLEMVIRVPGPGALVRLRDDGKAPDETHNDGFYCGAVRLGKLTQPLLAENLELHLDTVSSQHSLLSPGQSSVTTGEGSPLLGGKKRVKAATSFTLPVRWSVAGTAGEARGAYERRWGTGASAAPDERSARSAAGRVQLVAVQARWSLAKYRDETSFREYVESLLRQVDTRREPDVPCLVAFPEFIGLPLIFTDAVDAVQGCTRWREAGGLLIRQHEREVGEFCRKFGVSPIRGLMLARGRAVRRIYSETFSQAAARHHCYLAAGTVPLPDQVDGEPSDGSVYNTAFLFGPDGALLGTQKKVHPYAQEGTAEGLDLVPGRAADVRALSTELGMIGIAVCYDAWQADVMDTLARQEAAIVVQPSANAHVWDEWQQGDWKKGLWQQVQLHAPFQYGVNPMMVGSLFAPDDEYATDGQSSILTKSAGTPDGSGYLSRAALPEKGQAAEQIVISTVQVR